jgi:predicted dehydrogenase
MMRGHPLHEEAARMAQEGELGRIVFARAQLSCWYPSIDGAWRQDPERGGGGSLVDLGSHCIDLLEWLLGSRVREVTAFQASLVQDYPVEDIALSLLRFEDGALAAVDNGFNIPDAVSPNRLAVYGTAGAILAEGTLGQESGGAMRYRISHQRGYEARQLRIAHETEGWAEISNLLSKPLYAREIDQFSEGVRWGTPPACGGEAGLWNARVIEACYESARTGRTVTVA